MADTRPETGNVVGVDPHRHTITATILDERGAEVATEHFTTDVAGFEALVDWAAERGPVLRWGVEGASGLGRHLSAFLVAAGCDVRDVPPHRTGQRQRGRHQGKSDVLDARRVAAETQSNPSLARAFKQAAPVPADRVREQLALWHNARRSLVKMRVQLLGEIDALLHDLPESFRRPLAAARTTRARINAFEALSELVVDDTVDRLRLELVRQRVGLLRDVAEQEKQAAAELDRLVAATKTTLTDLVGIAPRAAAELLVEVGDSRRFSEAGFARFNGTAPLPASSGEGRQGPRRHRLNRGGNRRLNALIHRMALTQLRADPRARQLYDNARSRGHTGREAIRILKRHLSNVIYRTMLNDARREPALT